MAYTFEDGPSWQDSVHTWTPALDGTPPPAIHDRITDPPTLPWIKLLDVAGWGDMPEQVITEPGRTNSVGISPAPPRILGRTFIYKCEARATSREDIAELRTGLVNGFGADALELTQLEGTMLVTPYEEPGGIAWQFTAHLIDFKGDNGFSYFRFRRAPFRWGCSVHLRLSDPLFYTVVGGLSKL